MNNRDSTNESAHVLVVDDQPENLLILDELLSENHAVHTATSAEEALAYLEAGGSADLIISDVIMPGMGGFELCRRLKAQPQTAHIPVLLLSSLETASDEALGLSLGAEDFIHKPFSPPVVLARVRNQLKLSRIARELRSRNADLEAFSYSVSHDLRAPLRAINGYASLVRDAARDKLDAAERELLERVIVNSVKLGRLIDDLLEYSRAGRAAHAHLKVDMESLVRDVAAEAGSDAPAAQFRIGALPAVLGDEAALRQVLVNLICNAVKFSAPRERPEIVVSATAGGRETVFSVHDNGVGFDMAFADRLFGMFQRMHTASQFAGTGVGLAIVKRIVERHGGRVWAESAPDQGATFHFTLPRA